MKLTVAIAQLTVASRRPEINLSRAEDLISEASRRGAELVCLPEMWTTGIDWKYVAETAHLHARTMQRAAALAERYRIWINGTMPCDDGEGGLCNASVLFSPSGAAAAVYAKTHLFSPMDEDRYLTPGSRLVAAAPPWGLTGLSVCYDLRFPELFRSYALRGVQVLLCPAAFPVERKEHWKVLVRARAIENGLFMIAVNQVGQAQMADGKEALCFCGCSCIIDPWGGTVLEAGESEEVLLTATLDLDQVDAVRRSLPVLQDRRPDLYDL